MKKQAKINRENAAKIAALLSRVRGDCRDLAAKRRLREAEEKLTLAPPVDSEEAAYIDEELIELLSKFAAVSAEGVLTQRYLDRIELLLSRRAALS